MDLAKVSERSFVENVRIGRIPEYNYPVKIRRTIITFTDDFGYEYYHAKNELISSTHDNGQAFRNRVPAYETTGVEA